MFETFSGGYYLGRLYVEPAHRTEAAIPRDEYHDLVEQVHGAESTAGNTPLVMRINDQHFTVMGARQIPAHTLVLPEQFVDRYEPNRKRGVLLAKAEVAERLMAFSHAASDQEDLPLDPFVPDALRGVDPPN